MKLFVIKIKKLYPVITAAKIFAVLTALLLSCVLVLENLLDTPIFVEAAANETTEKIIIIDGGTVLVAAGYYLAR